jgi:hypothetical protein
MTYATSTRAKCRRWVRDGRLTVVEDEAERVRLIFRKYLEVSGINELVRELRDQNIRTKVRVLSSNRSRGGIPFGRGMLSHLLRNRFFVGEVAYKGEILPGEQPAIIDRDLFDAVQQKLSDQQSHTTLTRQKPSISWRAFCSTTPAIA